MQPTQGKQQKQPLLIGDLNVVKRIPTGVADQEIVVGWNVYRGKKYVPVRVFALHDEGDLRPTRRGITFNRDLFVEIANGLERVDFRVAAGRPDHRLHAI